MATRSDDAAADSETAGDASARAAEPEGTPNPLLNGIIGGVVGVVLFFIPFSTVLGGGVAGYLEGGELVDGAKVGGVAGIVALLPVLALILLVGAFTPFMMGGGRGVPVAVWLMMLFMAVMAVVYVVGLSILGGVIGVYVKREL